MNAQVETVEAEIQRKGLTAPRITPADVEANIESAEYLRSGKNGSTLTICILYLRNGFTVTGESACASPENFNAELGERIACDNAKQKIWALMGYALRERLHECSVPKSVDAR